MSEETKLKPCPFCGSDARIIERDNDYAFTIVSCSRNENENCGVCQTSSLHRKEAIDEWNTRPIEDALRARAERAETALEKIIEQSVSFGEMAGISGMDFVPPRHQVLANIARDALKGGEG